MFLLKLGLSSSVGSNGGVIEMLSSMKMKSAELNKRRVSLPDPRISDSGSDLPLLYCF